MSPFQLLVNSLKLNKYMENLFIGIDYSKKSFDVSAYISSEKSKEEKMKLQLLGHQNFSNDETGYIQMLSWLGTLTSLSPKHWLFCGEDTGLYSYSMSHYLYIKGFSIWLENPLHMKRSMGLVRGKSDKKDSGLIALYSYRFRDRRVDFVPRQDTIQRLQDLEAYRHRLIKAKKLLGDSSKELNLYEQTRDTAVLVYEKSMELVEQIESQLKEVEVQIQQVLKSDKEVYDNYERITSVKGISWKTAVVLLIYSHNFTRFETARQFACYAGVAPFEYSSGTSVKGGTHTSRLANMKVKSLLGMAAMSAKRFNKDIAEYYNSKKEKGKSHRVIMNNISNKLIHICFALVRHQTTYQYTYKLV